LDKSINLPSTPTKQPAHDYANRQNINANAQLWRQIIDLVNRTVPETHYTTNITGHHYLEVTRYYFHNIASLEQARHESVNITQSGAVELLRPAGRLNCCAQRGG